VRQDRIEQGWAVLPLFDWRRVAEDQQIDSLPVNLREQLAITAQRIADTFEFGARVRERIAARGELEGDYYRSRAAWNRAVARFERTQADALRAGHLLATPWRPIRPTKASYPRGWVE
jgi:hypothetical protein